jgi:hypothetical protein
VELVVIKEALIMTELTIKEQVAAAATALEEKREFAAEEAEWSDSIKDSIIGTSRAYLASHKGLSSSRKLVEEARASVELRRLNAIRNSVLSRR